MLRDEDRGRDDRSTRAWLLSAVLLGSAQQVFVVLRNPFLDSLHFQGRAIGWVQASGGAAGIAAGLIGLRLFGRIPWRTAFALAALANAVGFGIQAASSQLVTFVFGAALAGLGVQGLTMTAAPFLSEKAPVEGRSRLFATHALFIQGIPGAAGALAGGQIEHAVETSFDRQLGFRIALAVGAGVAAVALMPMVAIRGRTTALGARLDIRELRAFAPLLLPDALLFFAQGLCVPFLQLYFVARFGFSPVAVGRTFALAMVAGAAAQLSVPWVAVRAGSLGVVRGAAGFAFIALLVLDVTSSPTFAVIAFVARQTLVMASAPMLASFLHRAVEPARSARLAATRMIALSVSWAAANVVGGVLLERDPLFHDVLAVAAAFQIVGLGAALFWYRQPRVAAVE